MKAQVRFGVGGQGRTTPQQKAATGRLLLEYISRQASPEGKKVHFIMIKELIYQEVMTIPNNSTSKYKKGKLTEPPSSLEVLTPLSW